MDSEVRTVPPVLLMHRRFVLDRARSGPPFATSSFPLDHHHRDWHYYYTLLDMTLLS